VPATAFRQPIELPSIHVERRRNRLAFADFRGNRSPKKKAARAWAPLPKAMRILFYAVLRTGGSEDCKVKRRG